MLSDILRSVRLRGGVFLDARLTSPWAVDSVVTSEACKPLLSRPSQLIAYHMVIEGQMALSIDGEGTIRVKEGEIVLLPRNDVHVAASAAGIAPVDGHSLIETSPGNPLAQINYGGGGAAARLFCGFLGCEDGCNPLIAALPRVLVIDMREAASKNLVEASIKFAVSELSQGRLADGDVISRLSELLLIEAVRRYAESLGENEVGWLKALKDPSIGRALVLVHHNIATPWTAEGLAREIAVSRSTFIVSVRSDRYRFQRHGSRSSTLVILWSGMRARVSASQAFGSTAFSFAVSIRV